MSTTAPVEVGQIRQSPADDGFVIVRHSRWSLDRVGWTVRPVDRFGRPTGEPDRWVWNYTITRWPLIDPATITEPQ
jgi:hypothetical protein